MKQLKTVRRESPALTLLNADLKKKLPMREVPSFPGAKTFDVVFNLEPSCGNLTAKYKLGAGEEGMVVRALIESTFQRARIFAPGIYSYGVRRDEVLSCMGEAASCLEVAGKIAIRSGESSAIDKILYETLSLILRHSKEFVLPASGIRVPVSFAGGLYIEESTSPFGRRIAGLLCSLCSYAGTKSMKTQMRRAGEELPTMFLAESRENVYVFMRNEQECWQMASGYFDAVARGLLERGLGEKAKNPALLALLCGAGSAGSTYARSTSLCFSNKRKVEGRFGCTSCIPAPDTEDYLPGNYAFVLEYSKKFGIFAQVRKMALEILPKVISSGKHMVTSGRADSAEVRGEKLREFISSFELMDEAKAILEGEETKNVYSCVQLACTAKGMGLEEEAAKYASMAMEHYRGIWWWRRYRTPEYESVAKLAEGYSLEGKNLRLSCRAKKKVESELSTSGGSGASHPCPASWTDSSRMGNMGGD